MSVIRSALVLLLLSTPFVVGAEKLPPRIRSADFPSVSRRAPFFEQRINAADAVVRRRVLLEVSYFFSIPDKEYVSFLRRMISDLDPIVRGRALLELHNLWVPIDVKDLPQTFAGFHDRQLIDRGDTKTIPGLLAALRGPGAEAGHAAYVLGLLRHEEATAELRKLASHRNIFVRYAAARALFDCGDREAARPIFEKIVRSQLGLYENGRNHPDGKQAVDDRQPYYAIVGCQAIMQYGREGKKAGLEKLITLISHLEQSADANDQGNLPFARQVLADGAGTYLVSAEEAWKWYRRQYGQPQTTPSPRP